MQIFVKTFGKDVSVCASDDSMPVTMVIATPYGSHGIAMSPIQAEALTDALKTAARVARTTPGARL